MAPPAQAGILAAGWGGTILASSDGESWAMQDTSSGSSMQAIAPGWPSVAVGNAGATISSNDGTTWSGSPSGTPQWLSGIARSGATWTAVGITGTILRRTGSGPWVELESSTMADLNAIATDGGNWVAVGSGVILTSSDGTNWVAMATGANLAGVAYGNGGWIAVGAGGVVLRSTDLDTWQPISNVTTASLHAISHGSTSGQWVAVGAGGAMVTSADGVSWQAVSSGTATTLRGVAADCDGAWVAVGDAGTIVTSDDGATWMPAASGTLENLRAAACTPDVPTPLTCTAGSAQPGQNATVQANGGTLPFQWSSTGTAAPSTNAIYSVSFEDVGSYDIQIQDSGTLPYGTQSASCLVVVAEPNVPDEVEDAPNESASDSGSGPGTDPFAPFACLPGSQTVAKDASAAFHADNGDAPFSWSAPGSEESTAGAALVATYAETGTFQVSVTDQAGHSATCTINVVEGMVVSAGGPYTATLGNAEGGGNMGAIVHLAASIQGGAAPYTCNWSGSGAIAQRSACSTSATYTATGEAQLLLQVSDSSGLAATASTTVQILPAAAPVPAPASLRQGAAAIHGQSRLPDGNVPCPDSCSLAPPLASAPAPTPSTTPTVWPNEPDAESLGIVAAILLALATMPWLARQGILFATVVLFSRLRGGDLLDNPIRAFLVERIAAEPGIHFRELLRASGKGHGTVHYHLTVLVRAGTLQPIVRRGFTGYKLAESTWTERLPASRALKAAKARQIVEFLREADSMRLAEIAMRCGITYAGALYHVQRLHQAGLIQMVDVPGEERFARLPPIDTATGPGAAGVRAHS